MAKLLKLRRGTTSQHSSFTGAEGEVTVDTDKETLIVHDGSTAGGHPVAAEDMANVSSASIVGRLSNASVATSKIASGALPTNVTIASANIVDASIVTADIANGSITTDKLGSDSVTGAKIADDAINSEHYTDGSIDTAHIANSAVSNNKLQDNSIVSGKLADSGVNSGSYGSATAIPAITVNNKGQITAASTNTVNTTTNLAATTTSSAVTVTSSTGNNATIAEASGSAAGVMSVTHHNKLDGIAANATNNGSGSLSSYMPLGGGEFTGDVIAHNIRPDGSSRDLGTSSYRWNNIYTNDLNLSNEGSSNNVDGTWGSYTIQEGAEDLFLINKRNGKKYKFNLTEVS